MAPDWEEREEKLRALLRALDLDDLQAVAGCLRNDLQRAAVSLRPEVGGALRALRQAGCAAGLVSGSGPAVFGLAPRRLDARSLDELAAEASARLREGDPLTGRRAAGTYRFIGLPPVQGLSPPGGEP